MTSCGEINGYAGRKQNKLLTSKNLLQMLSELKNTGIDSYFS